MSLYRMARPAPAYWNVLKTIPAVAVVSFAVGWAVPLYVVGWQRNGVLEALLFHAPSELGAAVILSGTLLVLWAALELAIEGGGTPMSFDAPRRLVVSGPYAWFRNPMVAGLVAQGIGVGIYTGSVLVMLLFAAIALSWDTLVRPGDEDELQRVFGRDFELYRRSVRRWLPMRRRWTPPPQTGPISLEELPERKRVRRR